MEENEAFSYQNSTQFLTIFAVDINFHLNLLICLQYFVINQT